MHVELTMCLAEANASLDTRLHLRMENSLECANGMSVNLEADEDLETVFVRLLDLFDDKNRNDILRFVTMKTASH